MTGPPGPSKEYTLSATSAEQTTRRTCGILAESLKLALLRPITQPMRVLRSSSRTGGQGMGNKQNCWSSKVAVVSRTAFTFTTGRCPASTDNRGNASWRAELWPRMLGRHRNALRRRSPGTFARAGQLPALRLLPRGTFSRARARSSEPAPRDLLVGPTRDSASDRPSLAGGRSALQLLAFWRSRTRASTSRF